MKYRSNQGEVNLEGDFEVSSFRVETSAKMFEMMASDIYSDIYKAIVQELSANAADSHKKRGTDRPFDVKFPQDNRLDDGTFVVRDYGVGMTEEEIREVYTVLFKSDKDHSNNYTGCFGVGSKSPLAYTDHMTVETIVDGTKRTYLVFKWGRYEDHNVTFDGKEPEVGTPVLSPLWEGKTDEEQGVRIQFPVKKEDRPKFREAGKEVLKWFDNVNPIGIEISRHEPTFEGEDWEIHKKLDSDGWSTPDICREATAVMGNVAYPIDKSKVSGYIRGAVIWFDLGTLKPSTDRESLQYDERTVEEIEAGFQRIRDHFKEQVEEKVGGADNIFEARAAYGRLNTQFVNEVTYDGQTIISSAVDLGTGGYIITDDVNESTGHIWYDFSKYHGYETVPQIVYEDTHHSKYVRCKKWVRENNRPIVLVYQPEAAKDALDADDYLKVSELELPERTYNRSSVPSDKADADFLKWGGFSRTNRGCWKTGDLPTHATYVTVHRYKWSMTEDGELRDPKELKDILKSLRNLGINTPIWGVKRRADAPDSWVALEDALEEMWEYFADEVKERLIIHRSRRFHDWPSLISRANVDDLEDPELKRYAEMRRYHSFGRKSDIDTLFSVTVDEEVKEAKKELSNLKETIKERYPFCTEHIFQSEDTVTEYFNALWSYNEDR